MHGEIPTLPSEFDQLPASERKFFEDLARRRPTMFKSGRQAYQALLRDLRTIEGLESGQHTAGGFPTATDQAKNYIDTLREFG